MDHDSDLGTHIELGPFSLGAPRVAGDGRLPVSRQGPDHLERCVAIHDSRVLSGKLECAETGPDSRYARRRVRRDMALQVLIERLKQPNAHRGFGF